MEGPWRAQREVDERTRELAAASSRVVLSTHVEPSEDMKAERARSALDSRQLAEYLNGGKEKLQRMCACIQLVASRVAVSNAPSALYKLALS